MNSESPNSYIDPQNVNLLKLEIHRIREILNCSIFSEQNVGHVLFQSAFIETVIRLNELLQKAHKYNLRVDFTDDVEVSLNPADVTSLVNFFRNCVCHVHSPSHQNELVSGRFSFCVSVGGARLFESEKGIIDSRYRDDIAFYFGPYVLYFKRHIVRSFNEVCRNFKQFL